MKTEVVIAGAGPTGLSLACQLVRFGIDFVIFDKKEGVTTLSKALGVHARTLEIYEQLGIADEAVARGTIADKMKLIGNGKVHDGFSFADMGGGISPFPYMLVLEQSKNEEMLYEYLQKNQRDVLWNSTLESFSQGENGVKAAVRQGEGGTRTIEANYLVGCDGASSVVRKSLGLDFTGETEERLFYVADTYMKSAFAHDTLHSCFSQDAFVFFFPMANDSDKPDTAERWRILGNLPEHVEASEEVDMSDAAIEQRIEKITKLPFKVRSTKWSATYRVHTRHVDQFIKGRCFLAGDAAHVHTPAGGQGMNTGIQDAYNLGWKLALVLKGQADKSLLETYEQERLENAQNLVESTDKIFELEAGSNWFVGLVRSFLLPPLAKHIFSIDKVQRTLFKLISQVGISYPESALSYRPEALGDKALAVKAGDRMPYFISNGESIYSHLREPNFHLLTFSSQTFSNQENGNHSTDVIEQSYDSWLQHSVMPLSEAAKEGFGITDAFSVLVRPDNYIGFISQENLPGDLKNYFDKIGAKTLSAN